MPDTQKEETAQKVSDNPPQPKKQEAPKQQKEVVQNQTVTEIPEDELKNMLRVDE